MTSPRKEVLADGVEIWLGDCRQILSSLPIDCAVISDPPYGIGFKKGSGGKGKHTVRNIEAIAGDNEPFDPSPLLSFAEIILWGANHYATRLPHGRWLAWDKLAGLDSFDSFSDVEFAWQNKRAKDLIFSHLWKGLCKDSEKGGKERWHPTQKPIALMEWCIRQTASATVLDPFMGSGTTGVACVKLGRRFTGIEIEERYFDVARRRISEALKQPDMFIEKPKPAQQQALWDAQP